jgi:hypothetical protein
MSQDITKEIDKDEIFCLMLRVITWPDVKESAYKIYGKDLVDKIIERAEELKKGLGQWEFIK